MSEEFQYPSSAVDIGLAKPAVYVTNASSATNTVGPDHACKRALIKAFTTNTGISWVNFGAAAVANQCFPLDAGESVSLPLDNTNEINVSFTVGNETIAVLYSN